MYVALLYAYLYPFSKTTQVYNNSVVITNSNNNTSASRFSFGMSSQMNAETFIFLAHTRDKIFMNHTCLDFFFICSSIFRNWFRIRRYIQYSYQLKKIASAVWSVKEKNFANESKVRIGWSDKRNCQLKESRDTVLCEQGGAIKELSVKKVPSFATKMKHHIIQFNFQINCICFLFGCIFPFSIITSIRNGH